MYFEADSYVGGLGKNNIVNGGRNRGWRGVRQI